MAVAEDEVVVMFLLQGMEAELDQHFLILAEEAFYRAIGMFGAQAAEPGGEAHTGIGMYAAIEPLGEGAAEYRLQYLIACIAGAKAIAMGYEELLAIELACNRCVVHGYIQLGGEVVQHPEVVVAREGFYAQAAIPQMGQLAEETGIAAGYYIAVLEPGIEQIADEVELCRIGGYLIQPLADAFFAGYGGGMVGYAEVEIGSEIYFFTGGQYHVAAKIT